MHLHETGADDWLEHGDSARPLFPTGTGRPLSRHAIERAQRVNPPRCSGRTVIGTPDPAAWLSMSRIALLGVP